MGDCLNQPSIFKILLWCARKCFPGKREHARPSFLRCNNCICCKCYTWCCSEWQIPWKILKCVLWVSITAPVTLVYSIINQKWHPVSSSPMDLQLKRRPTPHISHTRTRMYVAVTHPHVTIDNPNHSVPIHDAFHVRDAQKTIERCWCHIPVRIPKPNDKLSERPPAVPMIVGVDLVLCKRFHPGVDTTLQGILN